MKNKKDTHTHARTHARTHTHTHWSKSHCFLSRSSPVSCKTITDWSESFPLKHTTPTPTVHACTAHRLRAVTRVPESLFPSQEAATDDDDGAQPGLSETPPTPILLPLPSSLQSHAATGAPGQLFLTQADCGQLAAINSPPCRPVP